MLELFYLVNMNFFTDFCNVLSRIYRKIYTASKIISAVFVSVAVKKQTDSSEFFNKNIAIIIKNFKK